ELRRARRGRRPPRGRFLRRAAPSCRRRRADGPGRTRRARAAADDVAALVPAGDLSARVANTARRRSAFVAPMDRKTPLLRRKSWDPADSVYRAIFRDFPALLASSLT